MWVDVLEGTLMKRFQQLVADAKSGLSPWEPFPEERIPSVACKLDPSDIADIIAELDQLAREKSETPSWDGDTQDDIARAQHLFARLLAFVPMPLAVHVTDGVDGS